MAQVTRGKQKLQKKKAKVEEALPLTKDNYLILAIGVAVIVIGFIVMAAGGVEGFASLVLAPILLVAGYCVIVPFSILYKKREKKMGAGQPVTK
jgi:hypothetical protein